MGFTTNKGQISKGMKTLCGALLLWFISLLPGTAAVFVVENFDSDPGWSTRDGEMTVGWDGGFGYLGNGSMAGTFDLQDVPSPETDAMRISVGSSGGIYSGNFYTTYAGFLPDSSTFTFRFFSQDVLPSDLRIRIGDGSSLFSRSLSSQATSVGGWQTVTVNLDYAGWLGGTDAEYSNLFSAVSFIDLQISRNGEDAQAFFVDDFSLNYLLDEEGGGGDPVDVVPEVATTQFLLLGVLLMSGTIKRRIRAYIKTRTNADV